MKQLLLLSLFFMLASLHVMGQPPTETRPRSTNGSGLRVTVEFQLKEKENQLGNLLEAYQLSTPARQSAMQQKIRENLYAQFDLSIQQKEAEVAQLKSQLKTLQESEAYEEKRGEIAALQNSLQRIQGSINFRKAKRDQIVENRLQELLKQ